LGYFYRNKGKIGMKLRKKKKKGKTTLDKSKTIFLIIIYIERGINDYIVAASHIETATFIFCSRLV